MSFAEKVKLVREKLGLSQINLAYELNVTPLAVVRWESGQTHPNFQSRKSFCDFCERHGIVFDS